MGACVRPFLGPIAYGHAELYGCVENGITYIFHSTVYNLKIDSRGGSSPWFKFIIFSVVISGFRNKSLEFLIQIGRIVACAGSCAADVKSEKIFFVRLKLSSNGDTYKTILGIAILIRGIDRELLVIMLAVFNINIIRHTTVMRRSLMLELDTAKQKDIGATVIISFGSCVILIFVPGYQSLRNKHQRFIYKQLGFSRRLRGIFFT